MRWDVLTEAFPRLAGVIPVTLHLAAISVTAGFLLALILVAARLSRFRPLSALAYGYVYVIRGTPLLLQIFFVYYGTGQFDAVRASPIWVLLKDPYWCALIALTLNTAAYGCEIIRGGLLAVPTGQVEAAAAFGMKRFQRFRLVVFPQALRMMLPAYANEITLMLKATALTSTITIVELTGMARMLASETYAPVEVFIAAGAFYLLLNALISVAVQLVEARLRNRGGLAMGG